MSAAQAEEEMLLKGPATLKQGHRGELLPDAALQALSGTGWGGGTVGLVTWGFSLVFPQALETWWNFA